MYAVDRPGYGLSDKPDGMLSISHLADALSEWIGFETVKLVANSFGCQILAELAVRQAEQIDGLVFQGLTIDRSARSGTKRNGAFATGV